MVTDLVFFIPEIFVTFWLIVLLLLYTLITRRAFTGFFNGKLRIFYINPVPSVISLLIVLSVSYVALQLASVGGGYHSTSGIHCSTTVLYLRLLLSSLFVFYFFHLRSNAKDMIFYTFEFYIIIFFSFISLNLMLLSSNFLNLFIFIEIYSLCVYYLIGSKKNSVRGVEAAIKYFILGCFSSAFLLYGIFLIYRATGSIDFFDIAMLVVDNPYFQNFFPYTVGSYLVCFSLLFKMGASIFFFWIVEVYDGASFNMLIYLNIFPKIVYLITLFNLVTKFQLPHQIVIVKVLILSSLLIGLVGAINEIKTKRFLIFTSIYNITFFSMPFLGLTNEALGVAALFSSVYLFNFFIFLVLFANLKDMRTGGVSKSLIELHDIRAQNPRLAGLFIFYSLFASGLPLSAVFLAKFSFFYEISRLGHSSILLYLLLLSAISFFYYIRIVKLILRGSRLPNILLAPISRLAALLYTIPIWLNILCLFFYSEILLFLNLLLSGAAP